MNTPQREQTAIYRDLHDGISPVNQAVVDGSLTKDVDRNVQMCVMLDRKDSSGSQYSPLYWVERIYQALAARVFSNPKEAFESIMIQAKGKNISENQEKEVKRWLASMGMAVADNKFEPTPLVDNGGYSVIDYKQRQVAASFADRANASLAASAQQATALKTLGAVLAIYKANKDQVTAKVRVAELTEQGFAPSEVAAACRAEKLPQALVVAELLSKLPKKASKFRIVVKEGDAGLATFYVEADSLAAAKKSVSEIAGDSTVVETEEVSTLPLDGNEAEKNDSSITKKASLPDCTSRLTKFGAARYLLAQGASIAQCTAEIVSQFSPISEQTAEYIVCTAEKFYKDSDFEKNGTRSASRTDDKIRKTFAEFYAQECGVEEDAGVLEFIELDGSILRDIQAVYKDLRTSEPTGRVILRKGSTICFDRNGKGTLTELPLTDGILKVAITTTRAGVEVSKQDLIYPYEVTHVIDPELGEVKVAHVKNSGYVREAQMVPPAPSTPVSPGKKRVYDEKQKGWVEVDDKPTYNV